MNASALWKRLDTPGHDAASLARFGDGWRLHGTAVFLHDRGPACLDYTVDLDSAWRTHSGRIAGFIAAEPVEALITRQDRGWQLNGEAVVGLEHLVDLDFGFTPATNMQQLRRAALGVGEARDLPAAWFDVDEATLVELPQRYERRSESAYWYASPSVGYEAMLDIADNGFVRSYPGLWTMEPDLVGVGA